MENIDWKIFLSLNKNDTFNVTLLPVPKVKDEALKDMVPIILKNVTFEELENLELQNLESSFAKLQDMVSNVAEFEKSTEEKEKLTKMVKEKREIAKKKKEKDEKAAKDSSPTMFEKTEEKPATEKVSLDI